jgi:hypothetical protein
VEAEFERGPRWLRHRKEAGERPAISDGFAKLWERGRLDLSVEAVVVQPRFAALFTEDEVDAARRRLDQFRQR